MPEEQLWAMFLCAAVAGGSRADASVKTADNLVREYEKRFPDALRKYEPMPDRFK